MIENGKVIEAPKEHSLAIQASFETLDDAYIVRITLFLMAFR